MEFKCYDCENKFETEGHKKDYIDPMYGPCSKIVASCPSCGEEASEYRAPSPKKADSATAMAPCGMTPGQAGCSSCNH